MIAFEPALAVADAVLYEGFLLYPYTASAHKNQMRWQFGVVVPREYANAGSREPFAQQTEILLEPEGAPAVNLLLRFLHVVSRRVEVCAEGGFEPVESLEIDGTPHVSFDETVEREVTLRIQPLETAQSSAAIAFEGQRDEEPLRDALGNVRGRLVRERWPLRGTLVASCEPACEAPALYKFRVRVENDSDVVGAGARRSMLPAVGTRPQRSEDGILAPRSELSVGRLRSATNPLPQMTVDRGRREAEAFERASSAWIRERRPRTKKPLDGVQQTLVLVFGCLFNGRRGRLALDAAPHQFPDQTGVADRFDLAFDEEPREQVVVEVAVALARFDRTAHVFVSVAPEQ
jgi:hypothetical protein